MNRAALAIVCALLAPAVAQAPRPRFRAGTERVSVDVLVTDRNRPVGGLDAAAFELRDSGVRQSIVAVEMRSVPISLMLALDTSSSVRGPMLRRLAEATRVAVGLLGADDRAALLTFNQAIALRAGWDSTSEGVHAALASAEGAGFTSLNDAVFVALTMRDPRPGTRSLILVFSDGVDTMSWLPEQAVIEKANRTDAVVYTVGDFELRGGLVPRYGANVQLWPRDSRNLREASPFGRELADATGGEMLGTPRGGSLKDTFAKIVGDFRSRYVLTYTPEGVDKPGWHPIEVKLVGAKGRVRARRGYTR